MGTGLRLPCLKTEPKERPAVNKKSAGQTNNESVRPKGTPSTTSLVDASSHGVSDAIAQTVMQGVNTLSFSAKAVMKLVSVEKLSFGAIFVKETGSPAVKLGFMGRAVNELARLSSATIKVGIRLIKRELEHFQPYGSLLVPPVKVEVSLPVIVIIAVGAVFVSRYVAADVALCFRVVGIAVTVPVVSSAASVIGCLPKVLSLIPHAR